jgi:hypothetical protein
MALTKMELAPRRIHLIFGTLLVILPVVLWILLPVSLLEKLSAFFGIDDRLGEAYAFMLAGAAEAGGYWLLKRFRQRPAGWLSAYSLIGMILSALAIVVFFLAMIAMPMQGW